MSRTFRRTKNVPEWAMNTDQKFFRRYVTDGLDVDSKSDLIKHDAHHESRRQKRHILHKIMKDSEYDVVNVTAKEKGMARRYD